MAFFKKIIYFLQSSEYCTNLLFFAIVILL